LERVFVDTSAWVALFVANDANHAKAAALFGGLKEKRDDLYTSDYVVDETITVILARSTHEQSVMAGNALLNSRLVKIVPVFENYFEDAWKSYQKYADKRFSFTDVTSFAIMKRLNIPKAFAFDRDFLRAGIELAS
jgi:hypothetical protein